MEHCPAKLHTTGQLTGSQSLPRTEVICPQPRRAARVSCVMDSANRFGPRPKGISPMPRGDCGLDILDIILNKDDDREVDSEGGNQMSFFCGSPPVRSNNPVVHDAKFSKQTHLLPTPLSNSPAAKQRGGGSPTCGSSFRGSPELRIKGFVTLA